MVPNSVIRQVSLILVILAVGSILFWSLSSFVPALLGAYTLYILLQKANLYLVKKRHWSAGKSALLLLSVSFVILTLPLFFLFETIFNSYSLAIGQITTLLSSIKNYLLELEKSYQISIIDEKSIDRLSVFISQNATQILNKTINGVANVVIMYFILYFMLTESAKMERMLLQLMPLKNENAKKVEKELNRLVFSNAIGLPVIAIIQGLAGLLIYLLLPVKDPWLWFVLTCIASMIPIFGSAIAYIPVSAMLFANHEPLKGLIMLLYGIIVIGSIDNIFRIWLQKKIGDIHPLVSLFGVIVGIKLFGFIGLIFGPILISLFILLVKIYFAEFGKGKDVS